CPARRESLKNVSPSSQWACSAMRLPRALINEDSRCACVIYRHPQVVRCERPVAPPEPPGHPREPPLPPACQRELRYLPSLLAWPGGRYWVQVRVARTLGFPGPSAGQGPLLWPNSCTPSTATPKQFVAARRGSR